MTRVLFSDNGSRSDHRQSYGYLRDIIIPLDVSLILQTTQQIEKRENYDWPGILYNENGSPSDLRSKILDGNNKVSFFKRVFRELLVAVIDCDWLLFVLGVFSKGQVLSFDRVSG
jgi:hypothetical protein